MREMVAVPVWLILGFAVGGCIVVVCWAWANHQLAWWRDESRFWQTMADSAHRDFVSVYRKWQAALAQPQPTAATEERLQPTPGNDCSPTDAAGGQGEGA